MEGAGLITVAVLLIAGVVAAVFTVLGLVLRALGLLAGRGPLSPHQLNARRAAGAAFVGALCVYLVEIGGWPLDQLPPWVPSALMAVAGVALLLMLASAIGARERDPFGIVVSLVIAGGGYALLQWRWYVPRAYIGADYVPAALLNRLLPGVYIAMVVAGLVRALLCLLPLGGPRQPTAYDDARVRAVGAAFAFSFCLYVLLAGHLLLDVLPPWVPITLKIGAVLSLMLLASGLWVTRDMPRDVHGVGVSLAAAFAAVALLWWHWQMPPGPASVQINDTLPGLYIATLIAALVRALICARFLGGAWRITDRLLRRRARQPRPASTSSSGFWADIRASFERGRTGGNTRQASSSSGFWADMRASFARGRAATSAARTSSSSIWPRPLANLWHRLWEALAREWR